VTFTLPSISGKTLGTNNDHCTRLSFWLSCGATNATMAGNPGVQTYGLALWGVQLELGTVATPLEKLDPVTQLQQCQRFFEASSFSYQGYQVAGIYLSAWMTFAVPKRGNPTIAFSGVSYTNGSGIAALSPTPNGFAVAAIATAQGSMSFYGAYTVSADL
jgi:hypothetical protein